MSFIFALFFPAFATVIVVWIVRGFSQVAYAAGDILTTPKEAADVTE